MKIEVEWFRPESAPCNQNLIVWAKGVKIARKDASGQWRKIWGGPLDTTVAGWMPLPPKPVFEP